MSDVDVDVDDGVDVCVPFKTASVTKATNRNENLCCMISWEGLVI